MRSDIDLTKYRRHLVVSQRRDLGSDSWRKISITLKIPRLLETSLCPIRGVSPKIVRKVEFKLLQFFSLLQVCFVGPNCRFAPAIPPASQL